MVCWNKCHCLTAWTPALSLDHHIEIETAEIRDSAEKSPKHWRHRTDLGWSKRYLQRFRSLYVFILERKKQPQNTYTKHTIYANYMLVLEYIKVSTSEVDFLFLNADEQMELMELTTTMSSRQKLAQIKLTENQTPMGLRTWMSHKVKSRNILMHSMLFLKMYFNS